MLRRLLHRLGFCHWRTVDAREGWAYQQCRRCGVRRARATDPYSRADKRNDLWVRGEVSKPWEETPYRRPPRGPSGAVRPAGRPPLAATPSLALPPGCVTLTPEALVPPAPPELPP